MSKVSLSITSQVSAEDVEELLESLKPLIRQVISMPVIHITIDEED